METIQAFRTKDGKIFETQTEADLHEMGLAKHDVFEEFFQFCVTVGTFLIFVIFHNVNLFLTKIYQINKFFFL